jgi:hypothetical protein
VVSFLLGFPAYIPSIPSSRRSHLHLGLVSDLFPSWFPLLHSYHSLLTPLPSHPPVPYHSTRNYTWRLRLLIRLCSRTFYLRIRVAEPINICTLIPFQKSHMCDVRVPNIDVLFINHKQTMARINNKIRSNNLIIYFGPLLYQQSNISL